MEIWILEGNLGLHEKNWDLKKVAEVMSGKMEMTWKAGIQRSPGDYENAVCMVILQLDVDSGEE